MLEYFIFPIRKLALLLLVVVGAPLVAQNLEDIGKLNPNRAIQQLRDAQLLTVNGGLALNMRNYNAWGTENRQAPLTYTVSANANFKLFDKINAPFSFVFNGQSTSSSNPFDLDAIKQSLKNRFVRVGISPKYKWATVHLGHRSMNLSPLTYANQTFYGVGTELNPGKFRFQALRGLMPTAEPVDLALFEVNTEVFNRRATAVKVGYGDDNQFLDLTVMRGEDRDDFYSVNADSSLVSPEENLVLGLATQVQILKSLSANLEIASSAYSFNKLGLLDAPNQFPHPNFLLDANTSTEFSTAMTGGWKFQGEVFSLGMDYQRFEPGYKSMGVYYFNDDLQNITLNTGFNFSKIQLNINLTGGVQTNNLDETKPTTVSRTIGGANVTWSASALQLTFNYNNFSNNVEYVLNPNLDSLNAVVATETLAATASYTLKSAGETKHSLSLAANSQVVSAPTASAGTGNNTGTRMNTLNLSYNGAPKGGTFKWTARANYNTNAISGMLTRRIGFGGGVTKQFFDGKVNLRFDNNYFMSQIAEADQNSLTSRLTVSYKLSAAHNINLNMMYLSRGKTTAGVTESVQEMINTLQYSYRFNWKPGEAKKKKAAEEKKKALEAAGKKKISGMQDDPAAGGNKSERTGKRRK